MNTDKGDNFYFGLRTNQEWNRLELEVFGP